MNKIILKKSIDNCYWDYRIIQKDNSFAIHEVEFFNNEVVGWTNQPDVIAGDLEDLRGEVEAMMEAFIKPVLKYNEINKPVQ